ncbi:flagellar basal body L-ring protein FlgH [Veronia pacifica]|uniref:Flagellar L-ring protein n=1 Tax=Veronia pacifica TaxID=1080227 RepID=A0A1C3EEQ6_9GAMM|nr:flagellar basal body L-ring protein FlgH [Veronia pacifica]ODA31716.1 flagellar basal body L-ring protein [Veronia pacifica]
MKRFIFIPLLTSVLVACSSPPPKDEISQGTSTKPAVETGDPTPKSGGLIDMVRQREDPVAGDPAWSPLHPGRKPEHYATATGSLFDISQTHSLYDDKRPHQIGDIVTVVLEEKTQAKKTASADATKTSDLSMDPLKVQGETFKLGEKEISYATKHNNTTSGTSNANQSNSISGSISVEVIDVLSNGNLMIRGEKWLTLNTGDEYIRLSGTIRPDDISSENTVASTRISNARIQYSGTGDRQDTQDQGWLARFFNVVL